MTVYRPKDEPWPGGRGVYDWTLGRFVPVVEIESVGIALDKRAHAEIQPSRGASSTERCSLYGGDYGPVDR